MDEQYLTNRIVVSKDIGHGKPRIAGTRILVHQVLDLLAGGLSIETITSDDYYPDISVQDVLACIHYASQIIQHDAIIPTI